VIKSVEFAELVEFAKMAVVEAAGMKFMKPWLKCAGMKFVQPAMNSAAMETEKSEVKFPAMEAGNAGVKSSARETTMESAAMKAATMEPAANCEVRPQESRTEN